MAKRAKNKLAVLGGPRTIPAGTLGKWPPIDETDRRMILGSLEERALTYGPNARAFEQEFAAWTGARHAIFTNSGTAALHMALVACGVGAGDHVLVSAYSWSSSATCILHHNAIPVFVDIDFATMNMNEDRLEAAVTPRTKAIVAVHLHGLALNMDKVLAVARRHKLKVIEDACQSHGALFNGRKVGTFGDCAAFSFNQNKCLCTGEGGMFVTGSEKRRKLAAQLWSFGETRTPAEARDYHAYALGWMYRGADMTAAFGRAQLAKLDGYLAAQRANADVLNERLRDVRGLILPIEPAHRRHSWYNYTCRLDMKTIGWTGAPSRMRDAVMKALQAEGVPVGTWQRYMLPAMTVFRAKNAYGRGCPWSCRGAGRGVSYDRRRYPIARRHADTHFGMTTPIRAPNPTQIAHRVADAFEKVFARLDRIEPDRVLGR